MKEELNCLPISTISAESERSHSQDAPQAKSTRSPISTSAKKPKKSIKPTSLKSKSIAISETTTHPKESTYSQEGSPVLEPVQQEAKQDLTTQNQQCGLNTSDVFKKADPDLSSSKIPQDYLIAEWEQSCKAYPKAGTMRNGRLSALPCLEVPKREKGFLSLPTLTTGLGSYRNAGATKCERFLRDKGILPNTQALSPQMMALMFAFPKDWTECLLESPREPKDATIAEQSLDEPSTSTAPPLPSSESSTLIEFSGNNIDARLQFLLEQKEKLIASGASPKGIWLNYGKVPNRDFIQVVWKSDKPHPWLNDNKSRYIGKFGSDEHLSAIAQHKAEQELREIERKISRLKSTMS